MLLIHKDVVFSFLNRFLPIFPKEKIIIIPGENKLVRIEAPSTDKISSLAIVKLLDKLTQSVIMLKVKFSRNTAMLDITNSNSEILILIPMLNRRRKEGCYGYVI